MARYIDADKIDFRIPYYPDEDGSDALVSLKTVKRCIAMTPTEDVAPQSEVERLKQILDSYAFQYGTVTDKQKVIEEEKREAVAEILGELEKTAREIERQYTKLANKYPPHSRDETYLNGMAHGAWAVVKAIRGLKT